MPQLLARPRGAAERPGSRLEPLPRAGSSGSAVGKVDASLVHAHAPDSDPDDPDRRDERRRGCEGPGARWRTIAVFEQSGLLEQDLWDHRQDVARARMTTEQVHTAIKSVRG